MKRKTAFKALVGSANYNLMTPESDKDYKVFVIPTFTDLYNGKLYTESKVGDIVDEEIHDIRKLVQLFWKSNVNFVEVLFSTELTVNKDNTIYNYIQKLVVLRDEVAAMNLPYLYKACKGMYESKSKYIEKGNESTRYLVEKIGYDSKSAMHAYRILDFIERFSERDFSDFKGAIVYEHKDRDFMLSIKNGELTKDEYNQLIKEKLSAFDVLEKTYMVQPINNEIKETLATLVYEMVVENVAQELQK